MVQHVEIDLTVRKYPNLCLLDDFLSTFNSDFQ
jgi:hypothetical protein